MKKHFKLIITLTLMVSIFTVLVISYNNIKNNLNVKKNQIKFLEKNLKNTSLILKSKTIL